MKDASRRRLWRSVLVAVIGLATVPGAASASPQGPNRFAGTYVSTQVTGASVVRLELSLRPDGRAQLRTGSSRYTQRPVAEAGGTTIETGTWHARNGRIVLHIEHSSTDTDDRSPAQYEDRTFVLSGCELRMVGRTSFAFDKQHCT